MTIQLISLPLDIIQFQIVPFLHLGDIKQLCQTCKILNVWNGEIWDILCKRDFKTGNSMRDYRDEIIKNRIREWEKLIPSVSKSGRTPSAMNYYYELEKLAKWGLSDKSFIEKRRFHLLLFELGPIQRGNFKRAHKYRSETLFPFKNCILPVLEPDSGLPSNDFLIEFLLRN